jgi:hypothetical protein
MQIPIYIASLEEPRAREQTVTENVSPHGCRVLTKRKWLPGERPLVTLQTGEFPQYAQVIYCDARPNGGFCVGIEFSGLPFEWGVLRR